MKVKKATICFYGFACDYSGTITNHNKGKFEKKPIRFTLGWNGKNDTSLLEIGNLTIKCRR